MKRLLNFVPSGPEWSIDWEKIENSELQPFFQKMKQTMQNPVWHGEGDVMTHTRMVCEELVRLTSFQNLDLLRRQEVFLAALLHDIGKIPCTRLEDGVWTSPNHTLVGSKMAREVLWKTYGLCGTKELQKIRETICCLIRYHSVPLHILEHNNPQRRLIRMAAQGELAGDFTLELLCILGEADVRGRITDDIPEHLEEIRLCAELAEEAECFRGPESFPSFFSRYAYLSGRNVWPGQELFDDTWGEVILMSGLPGTGKDTYIREHYGNLPVISLDALRKQMKILPTQPQGSVVNAAREQAKEYLRKKQPFVWNATSLSPSIREKHLALFHSYHASVRIIFLETEWPEMLRRNQNRRDAVPETVIQNMLADLVPPSLHEACTVEWNCV